MNVKSLILYYREKFIFYAVTSNVLLILLSFAMLLLRLSGSSGAIPLHYDILFGIDRLGSWQTMLWYPALAFLVAIVNFIFGYYIFTRDKYLSYYLAIMSSLVSIVTLLYIIVLISFAF